MNLKISFHDWCMKILIILLIFPKLWVFQLNMKLRIQLKNSCMKVFLITFMVSYCVQAMFRPHVATKFSFQDIISHKTYKSWPQFLVFGKFISKSRRETLKNSPKFPHFSWKSWKFFYNIYSITPRLSSEYF